MNSKEYCERMQNLKKKLTNKEQRFIENQCKVFQLFKGNYVLNNVERKKILKFRYVVIMGTGDYSKYITLLLDANQINYVGYVVTESINNMNYNERKVWQLNNYTYKKEDTLVVVGISQKSEESVLKALEKNRFYNVMTPLWPYGVDENIKEIV